MTKLRVIKKNGWLRVKWNRGKHHVAIIPWRDEFEYWCTFKMHGSDNSAFAEGWYSDMPVEHPRYCKEVAMVHAEYPPSVVCDLLC